MKQPEEIKRGLITCLEMNMSLRYQYEAMRSALDYIQRLEADNARLNRCIKNMTDKLIATNDALPCWISVKERLPEQSIDVLVFADGLVDIGFYNGRMKSWEQFTYHPEKAVTHWMPLPESPKEE